MQSGGGGDISIAMVKGFRQIAVLTILSRVLGMLRDMSFAFFLGAEGLMDAWVIAFKIPNLARRIFGEGAASSSFIPVYSDLLQNDRASASELCGTVLSFIALILSFTVVLGELVVWGWYFFVSDLSDTDLMLSLTGIMLPYMVLVCMVAILAGVLNCHGHFAAPAAAPVVLNIFIIGSLIFSQSVLKTEASRGVYFTAFSVVAAGFVQIMMQFWALKRHGAKVFGGVNFGGIHFRRVIFLMGPMVIGLTATQLNTLADDFIAKWLSGSVQKGEYLELFGHLVRYPVWEGTVSQLFYAQRLYQFPLGVLGISLATAIYPVMSAQASSGDVGSLTATISRGIRGAVYIAFPATVGLIAVRGDVVSVIFERGRFDSTDTLLTANIIIFYSLGLCGYFSQQILARAFYSRGASFWPAFTAVLAVFVNVSLNLSLIWVLGAGGLAISTAVSSYVQVIILLVVLRFELGRGLMDRYLLTVVKTACATAFMAAFCVLIVNLMDKEDVTKHYRLLRLVVTVFGAVVSYFAASVVLKIEMLSLVTSRFKK